MFIWFDYYNIVLPLTLPPPPLYTLDFVLEVLLKISYINKTKSIEKTTPYFLQLFAMQLYPVVL
jgi:hypothetical protein